MDGFWPVFYFAVFLKIPILFSIWIVWWAFKRDDEPVEQPNDQHGNGPRRPHPRPKRPRGPRRGDHAAGLVRPAPAPAGRQ